MERSDTTGMGRWVAAARISEAIRPVFRSSQAAGSVLGVHRSAVSVLLGGNLVTIARDSMGGLPNGLAVAAFDGFALGLRNGMPARTRDGCLLVDDARLTIDVRHAEVWSPRIDPLNITDDMPARARCLAANARRLPALGLRALLDDRVGVDWRSENEFLGRARPAADCLGRALVRRDLDRALLEGARLVGLGPGLTPSGDDLLVALTATLTAIGDEAARPLAHGWAAVAAERTGLVAATFHRHAVDGDYSERLHDLVQAVLSGPVVSIPRAVELASEWGASSGVDSVVGVAIALSRWLA